MTLSISIHDPLNIGDQVCNPLDYLPLPTPTARHNAWHLSWAEDYTSHIILGGGGLLHNVLTNAIHHLPRTPNRRLIAWSIGHNVHGDSNIDYGSTLDGFDLIGSRDYRHAIGRGFHYVPCASCLHPDFDLSQPPPTHPYITYSHHTRPIHLNHQHLPIPTWTNAQPKDRFASVLAFLASGDTVITNTYHGAYWSMLLGRKVLLYEPFSSRFLDFKHLPPFVTADTWRFTHPLPPPADFLAECRALNTAFHAKVLDHITPTQNPLTPLIQSPTLPSSASADT